MLLSSLNASGQKLELGGGPAYKAFLGKEKSFYQPAMGFELSALKQELLPFSSDVLNLGISIGAYRFEGKERLNPDDLQPNEIENFDQQLIETKMVYRYDYYYSDWFTFFFGSDLGFQFVTLNTDAIIVSSENPSTKLYTKAILAPNGGVNMEFNQFIALYYKLEYGLSLYLGQQPEWGTPSSKWNHLLTNSAGVRFRFY
ncbi:MAG: hypothetical protein WD398_16250 [Cyclobacteriaceae bacterium]